MNCIANTKVQKSFNLNLGSASRKTISEFNNIICPLQEKADTVVSANSTHIRTYVDPLFMWHDIDIFELGNHLSNQNNPGSENQEHGIYNEKKLGIECLPDRIEHPIVAKRLCLSFSPNTGYPALAKDSRTAKGENYYV